MSVAAETVVFHRRGTAVAQANAILDTVPARPQLGWPSSFVNARASPCGIKRRLVLTWFRAR